MMTRIGTMQDLNSVTMKAIRESQINCIFVDWFPNLKKINDEY